MQTYTHHPPPYRGTKGGRGVVATLPLGFCGRLKYLGNILPLIDSLQCNLQVKVHIMGFCAAEGL